MRRVFLFSSFFSFAAIASPFVVSDPVDPRVTHCGIFLDSAPKVVIPVTVQGADKICKHDIAGVSEGTHNVSMTVIANDPIWGSQESSHSAPLSFARPSIPSVPAGLELQP